MSDPEPYECVALLFRGGLLYEAMEHEAGKPAGPDEVVYVRADLYEELRDAGIDALGPHAEHEEHERWRLAAKRALHLRDEETP